MPNHPESIAIVGATSSIAEHCARIWLQQGTQRLVLVGRSAHRLEQLASDLRVRAPQADISIIAGDFTQAASIQHLVAGIVAQGLPQQVLIAHGSLPDQAVCQQDLEQAQDAMFINGISPVLFAEAFAGHMDKANTGTLGIIGPTRMNYNRVIPVLEFMGHAVSELLSSRRSMNYPAQTGERKSYEEER